VEYATPEQITNFLKQFKFFVNAGGFDLIERFENIKGLAILGLEETQAEQIVLQLTYVDYIRGPEEDKRYPKHNIWVFGYDMDPEELYIKLSDNFKFGKAKCLSFHIASHPLTYPCKN